MDEVKSSDSSKRHSQIAFMVQFLTFRRLQMSKNITCLKRYHNCLSTCLPIYACCSQLPCLLILPTYMTSYLFAFLPTKLSASLSTLLPSYLLTYLPSNLFTLVPRSPPQARQGEDNEDCEDETRQLLRP